MVILRPMTQDGCLSARCTVICGNSSLGVDPERAAGRGQPKRADRAGRFAVQALKNRRVLAVDRQNADAMLCAPRS